MEFPLAWWLAHTPVRELRAELVAELPPREQLEVARCSGDQVLAHTRQGIERWSPGDGWVTVVPRAGHAGDVAGQFALAYVRWTEAGTREAGVVDGDGVVTWRAVPRWISNTTTEIAVHLADDRLSLAYQIHTGYRLELTWAPRGDDPRAGGSASWDTQVDPAEFYFRTDGEAILVAGNGELARVDVDEPEMRVLDASRAQRAARWDHAQTGVVYSVPGGDRRLVAKIRASDGGTIWLSPDLSGEGGSRTWGAQALAYLHGPRAWIAIVDGHVMALRDADGAPHRWADDQAPRLGGGQWDGYNQLYAWFRAPVVATACDDDHVLIGNFGGAMSIWRVTTVRSP